MLAREKISCTACFKKLKIIIEGKKEISGRASAPENRQKRKKEKLFS
jgi:hypothetical protein